MQNGTDHRRVGALDHVAVLVRDTDEALVHFSGRLGLPVTHQERLDQPPVLLTWLDAGAVAVQLVQPLDAESDLGARLPSAAKGCTTSASR